MTVPQRFTINLLFLSLSVVAVKLLGECNRQFIQKHWTERRGRYSWPPSALHTPSQRPLDINYFVRKRKEINKQRNYHCWLQLPLVRGPENVSSCLPLRSSQVQAQQSLQSFPGHTHPTSLSLLPLGLRARDGVHRTLFNLRVFSSLPSPKSIHNKINQ